MVDMVTTELFLSRQGQRRDQKGIGPSEPLPDEREKTRKSGSTDIKGIVMVMVMG